MTLQLDRRHWERVYFGEVVKNINAAVRNPGAEGIDRVIAMEHLDPGELKIVRWGNTADGTTFTRRVKPGQTLFGKRRAYQRKAAYAEFEAITSGDILVFEADPSKLLPELLPFIVQSDRFFNHALGTSAGSLSPRTNWRDLSGFEFDLPPLDEQRRIASLCWAINRLNQELHVLSLQTEFTVGKLAEQLIWESSAELVPLGNLLESCTYGTSERAVSERPGSATPVLRIPNVLGGQLDLGELKYLPGAYEDSDPAAVRPGDFLVVRTNGNPMYVSRGTLIPELDEPFLFASYLLRLRVGSRLDPAYLAATWESASMKRALAPDIKSSAGNYNLSATSILGHSIPVPNLDSQREIVRTLTTLRNGSRAIMDEKVATQNLGKHLVNEIFGGLL